VIAGLRDLGKTVMLTTHYMDEAQELADRVAVIAGGEIIAAGTPDDLGGRADAASTVSFDCPEGGGGSDPQTVVAGDWAADDGRLVLRTPDPTRSLNELTGWALAHGIELEHLEVSRPSLEDVYLELTGTESGK
jgi:ABC-2 type transport system ATP-binding protein